jgi:hypothetical protein
MKKEPVIAKVGFCERRMRGASVSVRIPAESYKLLRKILRKMCYKMLRKILRKMPSASISLA